MQATQYEAYRDRMSREKVDEYFGINSRGLKDLKSESWPPLKSNFISDQFSTQFDWDNFSCSHSTNKSKISWRWRVSYTTEADVSDSSL